MTFYLCIGILSTTIIAKLLLTIMPSIRKITSIFSIRYLNHHGISSNNAMDFNTSNDSERH
jgi:hypothetical protein